MRRDPLGKPGSSDSPEPARASGPGAGGLCPGCRHVKVVVSGRGSTFLLCRLAAEEPAFRKYPPQPVTFCRGHRS